MSTVRPAIVVWAERLMLVGAGLGFVREALLWNQRVALDGAGLALLFTVGIPVLIAGLVLLVTRKRSRGSFVFLVLLSVMAWYTSQRLGLTDGTPAFTAGAASLILQTAGLLAMLPPGSRRWLFSRSHG